MSEFRRRLLTSVRATTFEVVDYIIANGNTYIDTGYRPNKDTEVELSCCMLNKLYSSGTALWYVYEGPYTYSINHGAGGSSSLYCWPYKLYGEEGASTNSIQCIEKTDILISYKYVKGEYRAYVNNNFQPVDAPIYSYSKSLYLLYNDKSEAIYNARRLKIYGFKILEQGTLIKHFVPAKQGDIYGMAEITEGKFYASPNGESFEY